MSIELANQENYLDRLFRVYPTIPEVCRDIDQKKWRMVKEAYHERNNLKLIKALLGLKLFPLKDSYVAYLKKDPSSIERNPATINRLAGRIYEQGLSKLFERCSEPKETNRQMGPKFGEWLDKGELGVNPVPLDVFCSTNENAVLDATDAEKASFAREKLNYRREKGLDLVARFNGKYVIGDAKFLTDFGVRQNAQFEDAVSTLNANANAITVAVLDGVLYIPGNHKFHRYLENNPRQLIMSALVLYEFLYQV